MKSRAPKFFAALLLSVAAGSAHSATCTPLTGCSASVDGTVADFCSIFQPGSYLEAKSDNVYTYNGRYGVECDENFPGMGICQFLGGVGFGRGQYTPGNLGCSSASVSGGTYVFDMQYLNGEGGESSTVTVHYQGGGATFESFTVRPASGFSFDLYVSGSSSGGGGGGGGGGDREPEPGVVGIVLIILFIAAVVTYVVVGVLLMKYWKKAEGVELIPNYHFWKDFPFLLKDGVVFTFTAWPCCKHVGFTKNYTKM